MIERTRVGVAFFEGSAGGVWLTRDRVTQWLRDVKGCLPYRYSNETTQVVMIRLKGRGLRKYFAQPIRIEPELFLASEGRLGMMGMKAEWRR